MRAVSKMAVFYSSLISCFPGMRLRYFKNDFEMVPFALIIIGVTFLFTFHGRCISIVRSLYFRIFSASLLIIYSCCCCCYEDFFKISKASYFAQQKTLS